jgi:hypothetical protein
MWTYSASVTLRVWNHFCLSPYIHIHSLINCTYIYTYINTCMLAYIHTYFCHFCPYKLLLVRTFLKAHFVFFCLVTRFIYTLLLKPYFGHAHGHGHGNGVFILATSSSTRHPPFWPFWPFWLLLPGEERLPNLFVAIWPEAWFVCPVMTRLFWPEIWPEICLEMRPLFAA